MKKSGLMLIFSVMKFDDAITYQIATALSEEMNMTLSQVLIAFENGGWYILHLKYPGLMESGGKV
jgi:hypothetical protein